jgi:uncharacterized protein (DUF58 family)
MTRLRLVFWISAGLFALAGLGTGMRIFFVLLFSQLFLIFCAFLINLWAALSFSYIQEISTEQTSRGTPVDLHLSVHNEKILPYPLMRVRLSTPDRREKLELDFNLAAYTHREFDLQLECPHRGEYPVGMTVIDFFEPFGLFRLPFDMRMLSYYRLKNLLVYPQLSIIGNLALPVLDSKSFSQRIFATDDMTEPFSMIRDYRRGDPRKLIHWKASLRQQKLLSRLFDQSAEPRIILILDLAQPAARSEPADQAEDVCCECAASLMQYVLRQNWPLQVVSLGKERSLSSGHRLKDFQDFYHWLATVEFNGTKSFSEQLAVEPGFWKDARAILIITPRLQPEIPAAVMKIRRQSQIPVYTAFALPAAAEGSGEGVIAGLMGQSGLPAWFIKFGDNLAERLGGQP